MEPKTDNYYYELPEGYRLDLTVDATDKKVSTLITVISSVILIAIFAALFLSLPEAVRTDDSAVPMFALGAVSFFVYIILHELVHGLFYKIFTKEKLKFGLTTAVAYCGVPDLYIKKWPMFVSCIAPTVVFGITFTVPLVLLWNTPFAITFAYCVAAHFSGCVGDIYDCARILVSYRGEPDLLINDNGPTQKFYVKEKQ